ncbi:unnamed protein product [Vitrella brassicaformis CCMP3155]|uniref:Uncharacterized protein n=2 Tax=Vitrella brassicaformis TaxID=1169539 RepID=A0A0G4E9L8_VITBC|nr:unnamed protein product [Vitrella brassicaformis CCMP3155]|mmetsp:Transcript_36194/g.90316  ORF Transcript_36194/g.90316 Transcript_36194/m.90316 type:complete len:351 (+) Transcript_36194:181-1233(+)|eukprot:CEL92594.1 unnamed protein product [Vitrella brassicaformis CCMP3155]
MAAQQQDDDNDDDAVRNVFRQNGELVVPPLGECGRASLKQSLLDYFQAHPGARERVSAIVGVTTRDAPIRKLVEMAELCSPSIVRVALEAARSNFRSRMQRTLIALPGGILERNAAQLREQAAILKLDYEGEVQDARERIADSEPPPPAPSPPEHCAKPPTLTGERSVARKSGIAKKKQKQKSGSKPKAQQKGASTKPKRPRKSTRSACDRIGKDQAPSLKPLTLTEGEMASVASYFLKLLHEVDQEDHTHNHHHHQQQQPHTELSWDSDGSCFSVVAIMAPAQNSSNAMSGGDEEMPPRYSFAPEQPTKNGVLAALQEALQCREQIRSRTPDGQQQHQDEDRMMQIDTQ